MSNRKISPLGWILLASGASLLVFSAVATFQMISGRDDGERVRLESGGKAFLKSEGKVGVLEINGVILDSKKAVQRIERFAEEDEIRALVVRLNSPGGAVAPSQEIYQAIRKLGEKKPVVASMGSVAASGAYYIACGAGKVYANPGTITGSIGVIMEFANLEKLYDWAKVQRYVVKTGKFKDVGAEYRKMTDEDRALLQGMIDDVLKQFKQAVRDGRKLSPEKVDAIADGRIFSGSQALMAGLVDEAGGFQEAVTEAAKLAGIKGKPKLVYPSRPSPRWIELLTDRRDEDADGRARSSDGLGGWVASLIRDTLGVGSEISRLDPGLYWLWR